MGHTSSVTEITMLSATRALVIEEEALVALDIQDVLTEHGVAEVVHHRSLPEVIPHDEPLLGFDLAIVEAKLGAAAVVAFTRRLAEAGVRVVVMSADHAAPQFFPHATPLSKPFDAASLIAACEAAEAR
jgi:DNA-binding NarL/FixJ family response regulator